MPDYLICTSTIKGGSFSGEPRPTRYLKAPDKRSSGLSHEIRFHNPYDSVLKLSNVKLVGVGHARGFIALPHDAFDSLLTRRLPFLPLFSRPFTQIHRVLSSILSVPISTTTQSQ